MRVVREELFVPHVRLPSGELVPLSEAGKPAPYRSHRIEAYKSALVVEIDGRQAYCEEITPAEILDSLCGREDYQRHIRKLLQEGILCLIHRDLFGGAP
jgi:hypothetical protein